MSRKEETVRKLLAVFTRNFYQQVCQSLFDKDRVLFSFLIAYKELECEVSIDMRQVEFFIKGPLAMQEEIFNVANLQKSDEKAESKVDEEMRIFRRRKAKIPWISRD